MPIFGNHAEDPVFRAPSLGQPFPVLRCRWRKFNSSPQAICNRRHLFFQKEKNGRRRKTGASQKTWLEVFWKNKKGLPCPLANSAKNQKPELVGTHTDYLTSTRPIKGESMRDGSLLDGASHSLSAMTALGCLRYLRELILSLGFLQQWNGWLWKSGSLCKDHHFIVDHKKYKIIKKIYFYFNDNN